MMSTWTRFLPRWRPQGGSKNMFNLNCWFCNKDVDAHLPDGKMNGWNCPCCQQYNGFKEDGDYDRPIIEQHETSKTKHFCQQQVIIAQDSVLCRSCNQNQALKVGQLSSFVPLSESSYEDEVDAYGRYLEFVYRLCRQCQAKVKIHLEKQNDEIARKLDEENIQLKQRGNDYSSGETSSLLSARRLRNLHKLLFWPCLLMAILNLLFIVRLYLDLKNGGLVKFCSRRGAWFVQQINNYIPIPIIQKLIPLLVNFGTGFCVVGLVMIDKTCIYIMDALHIVSWLLLLIFNALTSYSTHRNLVTDIRSPVYLVLSLSAITTCVMCLQRSRLPRNVPRSKFQIHHLMNEHLMRVHKDDSIDSESDKSLSLPSSPKSPTSPSCSPPSPFSAHVGKASNFFKPITTSPSISPVSFSSASPIVFDNQDQPKSAFEAVRDRLESFSFGLAKKTGSSSSIWSLPSFMTSDPKTNPDSIQPNKQQSCVRNILTPSRLSFVSLSNSPPSSPGPFSSSSPSSGSDSGFCSESSEHLCKNNPVSAKKALSDHKLQHSSTLFQQSQSFMKYRNNSNNVTAKLDQLKTDILSSFDKGKTVAVPDSTSNEKVSEVVKSGPRRSIRLAMRGKIIKPWPLKKSLSENNMFDRSNNVDFIVRKKDYQLPSNEENVFAEGIRKRKVDSRKMERIDEFSDDENIDDGVWRKSGKRILLRTETEKSTESKWLWTTIGLVIGISFTVNFFLVLLLWLDKNS